ncbi:MAG: hypothetical protein HRT45_04465 [Bdellovibrionales bacterium]|nr:hypothetical protein [Bdellovibrionales bacterium]
MKYLVLSLVFLGAKAQAENLCMRAFQNRLQAVCDCEFAEEQGQTVVRIDRTAESVQGEWAWLFEYNLYAYESGLPILTPTPNLPIHPNQEERQNYLNLLQSKQSLPVMFDRQRLPLVSLRLDQVSRDGQPLYFESELQRPQTSYILDNEERRRWVIAESYDLRTFEGDEPGEVVTQVGRKLRRFFFDVDSAGQCQLAGMQVLFFRRPDFNERTSFSVDECRDLVRASEFGPGFNYINSTVNRENVRLHLEDCRDLLNVQALAEEPEVPSTIGGAGGEPNGGDETFVEQGQTR